jgi:DNA mismatch repair protein MutL
MAIRILADQVIAQIAAGEVIERPASVIKELIENALDAGATAIHISIQGGGRRLMQVSDNGSGITADEVELAFARHATSKLTSADDLSQIQTLGFRGEALASIASVSRITLITRAAHEQTGTRIQLDGGRVIQRQAAGAPAGSVITVENLFYNTPARLKFLKAENTEKRQIALVISRYAIAYPHVRFVLYQDDREILRTSGSNQLADVLVTTLGIDTFREMIPFDSQRQSTDRGEIRVYGYTSLPALDRADRSRIILFVNGRWIQDASLTYAVVQAYHTLLMKGRYPVSVVLIEMPADAIDVNVHPTKAEVRFADPNTVFALLQKTLRRALLDAGQSAILRSSLSIPSESINADEAIQNSLAWELHSPGWYTHQRSKQTTEPESEPLIAASQPAARPRTLPLLRVIGQVGASYIVAEGPAGMYLIDQHAAHERILYEKFLDDYRQQARQVQSALGIQTIELSPAEARLIEAEIDVLQAVGFELEPFGPNAFAIRSVPAILADQDPVQVIAGILEELEQERTPGQTSIEDKIIQRVCKQAAVKAGTILSFEEMQSLIHQLERAQSPLTCPHGRPTMIHLSSDQLAREFGRK